MPERPVNGPARPPKRKREEDDALINLRKFRRIQLLSPSIIPSPIHDRKRSSQNDQDYQFTIASPDGEMHGRAVALFDFAIEHANELPLVEGQIILVSYRYGQGWLVAEDPLTGESGLVPEEYVRLVKDIKRSFRPIDTVSASPSG